jgi:hypothetical protein
LRVAVGAIRALELIAAPVSGELIVSPVTGRIWVLALEEPRGEHAQSKCAPKKEHGLAPGKPLGIADQLPEIFGINARSNTLNTLCNCVGKLSDTRILFLEPIATHPDSISNSMKATGGALFLL